MTGEIHVNAGKPPAHQMADELNELLTRWARTGLVSPPQVSDFLLDALAQTMVLGVQVGKIAEAVNAASEMLRQKVYAHVQRMAHMRAPQPEPPEPGKQN